MQCAESLVQTLQPQFERTSPCQSGLENASLLLVGGLLNKDGTLWRRDRIYVENAFSMMNTYGIAPHTIREAHIVNKSHKGGNEDFLSSEEHWMADIIVVCFVAKNSSSSLNHAMSGSPHHDIQGAWVEAAQRANAKIIVTVGQHGEVNETWFTQDGHTGGNTPYSLVQSTDWRNTRNDKPPMRHSLLVHEDIKSAVIVPPSVHSL